MSLIQDSLLTYRAPKLAIRSRLESSNEPQALLYLILGSILHFCGSVPSLLNSSGEIPLTIFLSANFIGVVIFAPLLFYFFAVVGKLGVTLLGWRISWIHSRVALFWAFFVVFPFTLIRGLTTYIPLNIGEILQLGFSFLIFAIFLTYWFVGLHEAKKLTDDNDR